MVEMLPFSSQTCTIVIARLGTVPVTVKGSPRRTFRLPWSLNVGTGLTVAVATPAWGDAAGAAASGVVLDDGHAVIQPAETMRRMASRRREYRRSKQVMIFS